MNDEITAMIGSLKKWQELCTGDRLLGEVMRECPLCMYHRIEGDDCNSCQLYLNGYGCVEDDSTWMKIYRAVSDLQLEHYTIDQCRSKTLTELIRKQLGHIKECLEQKGVKNEKENG